MCKVFPEVLFQRIDDSGDWKSRSCWNSFLSPFEYLVASRHHRLPVSPRIFLHLIETNIFEKTTLNQLVENAALNEENQLTGNQLILL